MPSVSLPAPFATDTGWQDRETSPRLLVAGALKERERERCRVEKAHPRVFAHPRLSDGRQVPLEGRDFSRDRLGDLALVERAHIRKRSHHFTPRERNTLNSYTLCKFGYGHVEMPYASGAGRPTLGRVLQHENARSVSLQH